jgi:hypothetical protein
MKPLLTGLAVLIFLIAAGVGMGVLHRKGRVGRERRKLARVVTALAVWIAESKAGSPDGTVPARAYDLLDPLLERELEALGPANSLLGPALQGMAIRLRLASQAFRRAYGAPEPDLPRCREAVEQLLFALTDLERALGLPGRISK